MVLLADAAASEATARTIQDITSIAIAVFTLVTAYLLWWYTKETEKLRVATQDMLAESQRQNANIEKNTLLPILFVSDDEISPGSVEGALVVRNVGNGPAFNVRILEIKTNDSLKLGLAFKPLGFFLAQGATQRFSMSGWINNEHTNTDTGQALYSEAMRLGHISADLSIVFDSANGEHHCTVFSMTTHSGLEFELKERRRGVHRD